MYFITDENGFYTGLLLKELNGHKFYTEVPILEHFVKPKFVNGEWIEGATNEEIIEVRVVPNEVPLWCIKAILNEMGLLEIVEGALTQLEEPLKSRANYIWEYGNIIKRDSLTVTFIGQVLKKDKTEIDEIFINANNIEL